MELSILTPTMRPGGLDVAVESLKRQTAWRELIERDAVEWLFVDELAHDPRRHEAFQRACRELGLERGQHIYPADYDPPRFSKLNRAHNAGLERAQGRFLLVYQDYIVLADDAIERFLAFARQQRHPFLLSGICHRIGAPDVSFLKGEGDPSYSIYREDFRYEMAEIGVREPTWRDIRLDQNERVSRRPCNWEANLAMVPTEAVREAGGWDERLDDGYSFDNVDVSRRVLLKYPRAQVTIDDGVVSHAIEDRLYWSREAHDQASERNGRISKAREERYYMAEWHRQRLAEVG